MFRPFRHFLCALLPALCPLAAADGTPAAEASVPLYLDIAHEQEAETYKAQAEAQDARGLRLYGEYLVERQDATGWGYLVKAAAAGEPRALFLMAERHYGGLGGTPRHAATALDCLQRSAQAGYAPAHEMLARAYWDADPAWGVTAFDAARAMEHLRQAIRLYEPGTLTDACRETLRRQMLQRLRDVLQFMEELQPGAPGAKQLPEGCLPTYTALLASRFRSDTAEGLRARLHYIQQEVETYTGSYHIHRLARLDLGKVRISINKTEGGVLAFMRPMVSKKHFSFSITANPAVMFPSQTPDRWHERYGQILQHEMQLMNTLAHELFHGYLCSRYPALWRKASQHASLIAYEGHATNAAYAFTRHWYFRGKGDNLSSTTYTLLFESPLYTYYFQRFRTLFMTPEGDIDWDKLDLYEQRLQQSEAPVHTRTQVAEGAEYFRPLYFGRAFYGYM